MKRIILENKPLVEAIFEFRWKLQENENGTKSDPHYPLLIGSLYEKIKGEYPDHEQLPSSNIPHEMASYLVQHRFRKGKDGWPLIQLGPGIFTINDTESYIWDDFQKRIHHVLRTFFDSYPDFESIQADSLLLRYIDAVEFDFESNNILDFLHTQMKIDVNVHDKLFTDVDVDEIPQDVNLRFSFSSNLPHGSITLRFGRGVREGVDSLIWETVVKTKRTEIPDNMENIKTWIHQAHELTDDWFFKIIEGELLERFK